MKNDTMLGLVVGIDVDDFFRSRLFACIYCGDTTQKTRDHVVSVAWSGYKRHYAKGDTVPACRECNSMLNDIPLHCISKRAAYIADKLNFKYRKILSHPSWTKEELKEMSSRFKFVIKSADDLKKYIQARITHAILSSLESYEGERILMNSLRHVDVYRILNRCYSGERYEDIEKSLSLPENKIKNIIQGKEFSSIIIAFKYEKGIPFDYSLLKAFNLIRKSKNNLNSTQGRLNATR